MKSYNNFKARLLKDNELNKAYQALEPEFMIAQMVIEKRLAQGLSQAELAERAGTKQSAISRLESGRYNPSLHFLEKVAKALDLNLVVSMN